MRVEGLVLSLGLKAQPIMARNGWCQELEIVIPTASTVRKPSDEWWFKAHFPFYSCHPILGWIF